MNPNKLLHEYLLISIYKKFNLICNITSSNLRKSIQQINIQNVILYKNTNKIK